MKALPTTLYTAAAATATIDQCTGVSAKSYNDSPSFRRGKLVVRKNGKSKKKEWDLFGMVWNITYWRPMEEKTEF